MKNTDLMNTVAQLNKINNYKKALLITGGALIVGGSIAYYFYDRSRKAEKNILKLQSDKAKQESKLSNLTNSMQMINGKLDAIYNNQMQVMRLISLLEKGIDDQTKSQGQV